MDSVTLFIAATSEGAELERVALDVFRTLGIIEHEERFSSNYPPDEHYFAGYGANAVVEVIDMDDVKSGFPFLVSVDKPTFRKGAVRVAENAADLAKAFATAGMRTFVPIGQWSRADWDGSGEEYAV